MNRSRCLGLVGGLGVGATIHYYERLAREHEARGRTLDLVIANAQTSRVFEYVQADDRDGRLSGAHPSHKAAKVSRNHERRQRCAPRVLELSSLCQSTRK